MRVAFCLFRYFPFGGLQRDFYQTALYFAEQGHDVHVYTMKWEGSKQDSLTIHEIPVFAFTNHGQAWKFVKKVRRMLKKEAFDCVIGFNKMPDLDFYYAADVCYVHARLEKRGKWIHFIPRDRMWMRLEKSVFSASSSTRIWMLTDAERKVYQQHYATSSDRMTVLPPSLPASRYPAGEYSILRAKARENFQVKDNQLILLMIASSLKTKGFDRVIFAYQALPNELRERVTLWVVGGQDVKDFLDYLPAVGVVKCFGMQEEVLPYLHAADVLVHPARTENTGLVLLESLVNGLPILTTANCGYASYVLDGKAGEVCGDPFDQREFNHKLQQILLNDEVRATYSQNGLTYGKQSAWSLLPPKLLNLVLANIKRDK